MKIETLLRQARRHRKQTGTPLVTISYAQSLDGSITTRRGVPLPLSGPESLKLWHQLRNYHDAVLVGIGTVLADDPQLNVRLVTGSDPQPVILDTKLRFPTKALALENSKPPWIITTARSDSKRRKHLESRGARVINLRTTRSGWIDLPSVLEYLAQREIDSIMVEGGARVITSFLEERLADYFVITITPFFVGGLHAIERVLSGITHTKAIYPERAKILGNKWYGRDLVLWGALK
jgi:3,4-dihydroxy 2-butanone 4-phosphate synthase/GTP cyclohydrolase II